MYSVNKRIVALDMHFFYKIYFFILFLFKLLKEKYQKHLDSSNNSVYPLRTKIICMKLKCAKFIRLYTSHHKENLPLTYSGC